MSNNNPLPLPAALELWHECIRTRDPALFDRLLAPDAVFESPVVFTPQRGKAIVKMYLLAAAHVIGNESFQYRNTWLAANSGVLEFTAEVDGIVVNGVDLISWNDADEVTHFKVMVRPLQAVNLVHKKMGELLAQYSRPA